MATSILSGKDSKGRVAAQVQGLKGKVHSRVSQGWVVVKVGPGRSRLVRKEVLRQSDKRDERVNIMIGGWKKPLTIHHLDDKPVTFKSKADLKKYAKRNKLKFGALNDSW